MEKAFFEKINIFFEKNPNERKFLLGYSGGYDSKALLYLLLKAREKFDFSLEVAHVDHKLRIESSEEAKELEKEITSLGLAFHLHSLPKQKIKSNLEDYYRNKRLQFFKKLFNEHNFDVLLLAHQKDDLKETVLKRFFEGADFVNLKGITEISYNQEMKIFRPLLSENKKDLMIFLKDNSLKAIEDKTNFEGKYLRSKMRMKLFPLITKHFGKEISKSLIHASERSIELQKYLEKNTKKYFEKAIIGPLGIFLDLTSHEFSLVEDIELRFFLKKISMENGHDLSKDTIKRIIFSVKNERDFSLKLKTGIVYVIRKQLFLMNASFDHLSQSFDSKVILTEGINKTSFFEVLCKKVKNDKDRSFVYPSYLDIMKGKAEMFLPVSSYYLALPHKDLKYYGKRLNKWFSENKVPIFLRFFFPVIFKEDKMYYEFLSGRKRFPEEEAHYYYKIAIKINQ